MIKKVISLGSILAVISAVAGFGLAFTYAITRTLIEQQIWMSQIAAAKAVLPMVSRDEDFKVDDALTAKAREKSQILDKVFLGYRDGKLAGYAMQMLPRGYGGPITLMVGVGLDGVTTTIKVVEHKETPGLGTGIEIPAWAAQFAGRKLGDPLRVNKEYDALSGATISSKAIGRGVREALEAWQAMGRAGE